MEIWLTKQMNNSLKVSYGSDYDKLKKLKQGEEYKATIVMPRNAKFLRKFFALVNMVFENQEIYTSIDHLRKDLTIEAGFYDEYVSFDGEVKREAKSISFAKMKENDFDKLYNKFLDTIVKVFKWERELINENIEQFY